MKYNVIITTIQQSAAVVVEDQCNGVTFINQGSIPARINGVILYPGTPGTNSGESLTFGGNTGEIFSGRIDVSFDILLGGLVQVLQKIYLPV